jgi:hypothetical protein
VQFNPCQETAAECRDWARRRYRNRPLLCSLTPGSAGAPERFLTAGGFDLSASRPVDPGRALLLKLRGPEDGSRQTLLARVTSADRRADGSWLVRCRFTGTPSLEGEAPPPAPGGDGLPEAGAWTFSPAGEAPPRPLPTPAAAS